MATHVIYLPIFFRVASLELCQPGDGPGGSELIQKNI